MLVYQKTMFYLSIFYLPLRLNPQGGRQTGILVVWHLTLDLLFISTLLLCPNQRTMTPSRSGYNKDH